MSGVTVTGVSAAYNGRDVVRDVSLSVGAGEWVAIIGPNGAGKTTLLRSIAGTVPCRGDVSIGGRLMAGLAGRARARLIAFVPQQPVIPGGMSALDYVLLGRTPYIGYWGSESQRDRALALEALDRLDAGPFADRMLDRLSGGERQRVVLARALAQDAAVLLLDEPTTALDIGHQQQVLDLVEGLRRERGIAVLSAFHDLTLAAQYADRLVVLDGGALAAAGRPAEVLTPDLLGRFSGARVAVLEGPGGETIVVPVRDQTATSKRLPTP
jgi:iron complex transport system ATP-binding protein